MQQNSTMEEQMLKSFRHLLMNILPACFKKVLTQGKHFLLDGDSLRNQAKSKSAWDEKNQKKSKKRHGPFLWMGFNCLKNRATSRKQFTFYHQVLRNSLYSLYRPWKDERLSQHSKTYHYGKKSGSEPYRKHLSYCQAEVASRCFESTDNPKEICLFLKSQDYTRMDTY